jgi:hypothetical protein
MRRWGALAGGVTVFAHRARRLSGRCARTISASDSGCCVRIDDKTRAHSE